MQVVLVLVPSAGAACAAAATTAASATGGGGGGAATSGAMAFRAGCRRRGSQHRLLLLPRCIRFARLARGLRQRGRQDLRLRRSAALVCKRPAQVRFVDRLA